MPSGGITPNNQIVPVLDKLKPVVISKCCCLVLQFMVFFFHFIYKSKGFEETNGKHASLFPSPDSTFPHIHITSIYIYMYLYVCTYIYIYVFSIYDLYTIILDAQICTLFHWKMRQGATTTRCQAPRNLNVLKQQPHSEEAWGSQDNKKWLPSWNLI